MKELIIDAENAPLGRLASYSAKQALLGKSIVIVNCDNAVVSGRKAEVIKNYRKARTRGKSGASALKGPHFPKSPERIVKRTIRGMLSYKQSRGNLAWRNIICHNKTPEEYIKSEKSKLQREFNIKTIKLKELSNLI